MRSSLERTKTELPSLAASAGRDILDLSPIPTLILRGGSKPNADRILYCNAAAQNRFGLACPTVTPAQSILDVVDPVDHETIRSLLVVGDRQCGPPLEVDIALSVVPTGTALGANAGMRFALHLQSSDAGVIAQLVRSDGWRAVHQTLKEQHRFRTALMELSDLAHATQDDEEFYQRLLERAVDVVPGAQGGSVQLNIAGTTGFRFVAAVGYDLEGLQQRILDREDFFRDASDPRAQIVREFANEERSDEIAEWLDTVGRLSEIVVNVSAPVVVGGSPVAFLSLDNFEDSSSMTETSIEMTTVLSRLIGDLWLRRLLETQLRDEREAFRHQAMHDPLTGLANRRSLDRFVHDVVESNRTAAVPSAVLFVDIDDFKGVNDRLGHDVGDMLLIAVANGLQDVIGSRTGGLVGRWGGDEFLVVPTGSTSPDQAETLAMAILERFERAVQLAGTHYRARLSVGIGWSQDSDLEGSDLVRCGDEALYDAKAAGKGTMRLKRH